MALLAYDLTALGLLLVDDNAHMRLLLRQVLRTMGIRKVREAADGAAGGGAAGAASARAPPTRPRVAGGGR